MIKLIKRLYNFFKGWDYRIKFLMVGGLNTIIGVGGYWLLLLIFGANLLEPSTVPYWQRFVATVIAQILGLINSYFWNKFFTFESKKKSKSELVRFIAVYLVAFGMDYLLKFLLGLSALNEIGIALITTLVTMVISFVGQKIFVFRHAKTITPVTDVNSENITEEEGEIKE